jgi:hypothetical protein
MGWFDLSDTNVGSSTPNRDEQKWVPCDLDATRYNFARVQQGCPCKTGDLNDELGQVWLSLLALVVGNNLPVAHLQSIVQTLYQGDKICLTPMVGPCRTYHSKYHGVLRLPSR